MLALVPGLFAGIRRMFKVAYAHLHFCGRRKGIYTHLFFKKNLPLTGSIYSTAKVS
jgi:hypothetical protein